MRNLAQADLKVFGAEVDGSAATGLRSCLESDCTVRGVVLNQQFSLTWYLFLAPGFESNVYRFVQLLGLHMPTHMPVRSLTLMPSRQAALCSLRDKKRILSASLYSGFPF